MNRRGAMCHALKEAEYSLSSARNTEYGERAPVVEACDESRSSSIVGVGVFVQRGTNGQLSRSNRLLRRKFR